MPREHQRSGRCPFILCQYMAFIVPAPTKDGADREMVVQHAFNHPDVTVYRACPASLVYLPLNVGTVANLAASIKPFHDLIQEEQNRPKSTPKSGPMDPSQFVPGSGREHLDLSDEAWQRGGREDEDVPEASEETVTGKRIPFKSNVSGGSNVASREELAALINQATTHEEEAHAALESAISQIPGIIAGARQRMENAKAIYAQLLNEGSSPLLEQALAQVMRANDDLDKAVAMFDHNVHEAQIALMAATLTNAEYIQALFSI
jgi:hypothetical protein